MKTELPFPLHVSCLVSIFRCSLPLVTVSQQGQSRTCCLPGITQAAQEWELELCSESHNQLVADSAFRPGLLGVTGVASILNHWRERQEKKSGKEKIWNPLSSPLTWPVLLRQNNPVLELRLLLPGKMFPPVSIPWEPWDYFLRLPHMLAEIAVLPCCQLRLSCCDQVPRVYSSFLE